LGFLIGILIGLLILIDQLFLFLIWNIRERERDEKRREETSPVIMSYLADGQNRSTASTGTRKVEREREKRDTREKEREERERERREGL